MYDSLKDRIFKVNNDQEFTSLALEIFRYQAISKNPYQKYINQLGINPRSIAGIKEIPFLPIELFKYHKIITGAERTGIIFESSGTTSTHRSRHYVSDPDLYIRSLTKCFRLFYGDPKKYYLLALLPSYSGRSESSLVFMVRHLIKLSCTTNSGFHFTDLAGLTETLKNLKGKNRQILLLGISFALFDFAEKFPLPLKGAIIMETGGMKGRREEITRKELHDVLKKAFHVETIHSEYGMTEMLSQAYSKGNGSFYSPPWMKVLIRDLYDPFSYLPPERSGGINIIDLANIYSCAFISTQDIGKLHHDGSFEVLGRADNSDIRGCNLLIE